MKKKQTEMTQCDSVVATESYMYSMYPINILIRAHAHRKVEMASGCDQWV